MNLSPIHLHDLSPIHLHDLRPIHLHDLSPINDVVPPWLELLHVLEGLPDSIVPGVHEAEGGQVHKVVLEVLQVERFYVLGKHIKCSEFRE